MSNVFVNRTGFELNPAYPVASGVLIEPGDLLKIVAGLITPMTAIDDNLTFLGRAVERHGTDEGAKVVTVGLASAQNIYEYDLDSATDIIIGDELAFSAKQVLTKSATDPIAVAVESQTQATKIRCVFKLPATMLGDAS